MSLNSNTSIKSRRIIAETDTYIKRDLFVEGNLSVRGTVNFDSSGGSAQAFSELTINGIIDDGYGKDYKFVSQLVENDSSKDELVLLKGTQPLMSISSDNYMPDSSSQVITFNRPVVMEDNLTVKGDLSLERPLNSVDSLLYKSNNNYALQSTCTVQLEGNFNTSGYSLVPLLGYWPVGGFLFAPIKDVLPVALPVSVPAFGFISAVRLYTPAVGPTSDDGYDIFTTVLQGGLAGIPVNTPVLSVRGNDLPGGIINGSVININVGDIIYSTITPVGTPFPLFQVLIHTSYYYDSSRLLF